MPRVDTTPVINDDHHSYRLMNTIKKKALWPTPWTVKHLNNNVITDNNNKDKVITRLETIFLRFLYQYEHILIKTSTKGSKNKFMIQLYCHDSSYEIFNTSCKNACTYFNNATVIDNNNNNRKESLCSTEFTVVDNVKDANIIFGFIPDLETFNRYINESIDKNNVFQTFQDEDINNKIYFMLYGNSECLIKTSSQAEKDQRSLSALQLEMVLNPMLKKQGFQSLKPINIEYGNISNNNNNVGKKGTYSGMGKKQMTMLNGGTENNIMLQSESWHVLSNNNRNVIFNTYDDLFIHNNNRVYPNGNNNVEDSHHNFYLENLLSKLPNELRLFYEKLITWGENQLIKWDTNSTFHDKNMKKFSTRDQFKLYLDKKVEKKFFETLKEKGYIEDN
jgi:hypothetical protein